MVVRTIILYKNISALPGITNYIVSLILISILFLYKKRIYGQFKLLLEQREKLEHMAYHDSLTEIPNRKKVIDHLDYLMSKSSEKYNKFILVFIDLDNFKKVNDYLGHYVGDYVLQMVVERISSYIHKDDILGRLGGDEFALIIERNLQKEEVLLYIEGIKDTFVEEFYYENKDIHLNASFGISVYPYDGSDSGELLKSADIAMYRAKNESSKSIEFFSKDMQEGFVENIQIENALQSSIMNNELYLAFQPQYSAHEEKLRGYEVLLRWNSPQLGFVSPAQFIPIAEKIGLINKIGEWVLRSSLQKFKEIYESYHMNSVLSINISVTQLLETDFVGTVKRIIEETGFDSRYLEFEVTESIFISYPNYVKGVLSQLKQMGISIALDDFGTGYASLSYLLNIPIDTLKIDKVFIDSINKYSNKKNIIGPIIEMAHQLDIMVIAEGVETKSQMNYLKNKDCDFIQGYLLSKPISEEQLIEELGINDVDVSL